MRTIVGYPFAAREIIKIIFESYIGLSIKYGTTHDKYTFTHSLSGEKEHIMPKMFFREKT